MSEWMPIESAPKDGTPIDVWHGNRRVTNVRYISRGARSQDLWVTDDDCALSIVGDIGFIQPSAWMPLPEPPKK